jgi:hypothetical protein
MKQSVKIKNGKHGFCLLVNGMYINHSESVKAIIDEGLVPYGATEWVSIQALRRFWAKYMPHVIHSTNNPHRSVWGQLVLVRNK